MCVYAHAVLDTQLWEWRAAAMPCPTNVGQSCVLMTVNVMTPTQAIAVNSNSNSSTQADMPCSLTQPQEEFPHTQIDTGDRDVSSDANDDANAVENGLVNKPTEKHVLVFFGGTLMILTTICFDMYMYNHAHVYGLVGE